MATTNTEHGPAAGSALGLVTDGFPPREAAFILSAAVLLALLGRLRNLV